MDSARLLTTTSLLGLGSSFWVSGIHFSASQLTMPILYDLPTSTSTSIFSALYYRGLVVVVPLAIFSAACSGVAAYLDPERRLGYALAAGSTVASLPWTRVVMVGGIERLLRLNESEVEREKASKDEVVGLLKGWAWQNQVRALFGFVGGVVGLGTFAGIW